jgi:acetolactate synthase small subunit
MVNIQTTITENSHAQGELQTKVAHYSDLLDAWKVLEKSAKELSKIELNLTKVASSTKEKDITTKTSLETQKVKISTEIEAQITAMKKDFEEVTITLDSIGEISGEKTKAENLYKKAKDDLKIKKAEKKRIQKEKSSLKKIL